MFPDQSVLNRRARMARKSANLRLLFVVSVGLGLPMFSSAATDDLLTKMRGIQDNGTARQKAIQQGKEKALLCAYCHGEDGNSKKPRIPNLAGQNPAYLLDQFERFRLRQRKDFTGVMGELVANMAEDDKVALAIYYANSDLKPVLSNSNLAVKGKAKYAIYCLRCHGPEGRGKKGYARINGQHTEYLIETLNLYKGLSNDKQDVRSRESEIMTKMTKSLSAKDIEYIAHYVSGLGLEQ